MEVIHERVEIGCRELNEALLLPFFERSESIGRGWAHRIWANMGDRLTRDTDGPPDFSLGLVGSNRVNRKVIEYFAPNSRSIYVASCNHATTFDTIANYNRR